MDSHITDAAKKPAMKTVEEKRQGSAAENGQDTAESTTTRVVMYMDHRNKGRRIDPTYGG